MIINEFWFDFFNGDWKVYLLKVERETPKMYYCEVLGPDGNPNGSRAAIKKEDIDIVRKVGIAYYNYRIHTFDSSIHNAKLKMYDFIVKDAERLYKED